MRINESILDDYTPEEELSSVKKLTADTISEDELLYPAISDFQVVLKLPVPDDVFKYDDAMPYIERTYEYLQNHRCIKRYSKIVLVHERFDLYALAFDHMFRRFDSVMKFIANLYISLQAKFEGYNSFKVWIQTKREPQDFTYRISEEYWFDHEEFRQILENKWDEIDKNHYLLDAAYRFLDDDRNLPYSVIEPERFCKNVVENTVKNWKDNFREIIRDFVCTLGVPAKVNTMGLYRLANQNQYSYISMSFPSGGKLNTVSYDTLYDANRYNDDTVKNVQRFFDEHKVSTDTIYFGEYKNDKTTHTLYAIVYLGSLPNLTRFGKLSKGITRCVITTTLEVDNDNYIDAVEQLSTCVSLMFGGNGYVYEQFKKIADKRFKIKK